MAKKKMTGVVWCYVNSCEHCGEFEVPIWGVYDDGIEWCDVCADAEEHKFVEPPKEIEEQREAVAAEVRKLRKRMNDYNEQLLF